MGFGDEIPLSGCRPAGGQDDAAIASKTHILVAANMHSGKGLLEAPPLSMPSTKFLRIVA